MLSGLCRCGFRYLAQAQCEPALIAGCRVLLNDAPLGGAIHDRKSRRDGLLRPFDVFLFEEAAQGANLVPQARLSAAIDRGPALGDSDTL